MQDLAKYALGNMTQAINDVASGIASCSNVTTNMADLETKATEISQITLRPLTDMQNYTDQIRAIDLPASVVEAALASNQSLTQAQEAMNITMEAL